jgi:hypothetical protein
LSLFAKKLLAVSAAVAAVGALIGLYVSSWATTIPKSIAALPAAPSTGGANLELMTVAAIGPKYSSSHPE